MERWPTDQDAKGHELRNFRIHSMTSAERVAMAAPKEATLAFDTDTGELHLYTFAEPEQSGRVSLTFAANTYKTTTVTFDPAFSETPKILLGVYQVGSLTGDWTVLAYSVTPNGMTIRVNDDDGTSRNGTVYVAWRAFL